jgi:hypothetical protein
MGRDVHLRVHQQRLQPPKKQANKQNKQKKQIIKITEQVLISQLDSHPQRKASKNTEIAPEVLGR